MKVRYIGKSFGVFGLTDGEVYECTEVDALTGALRIVIDSNDVNLADDPDWKPGYLFSPTMPKPFAGAYEGGKFEIVEDDEYGSLSKAING